MPVTTLAAIQDFLAQKRIAVIGVSRNPKDFSAGLFRELRRRGYDAIPVNPKAADIEGVRCFECVQEIQPPVDAALVMTKPDTTDTLVNDCLEAGVKRVWMYRATGQGAVSRAAVDSCRRNGIEVIAGFCPYMFLSETALFHRFHGFVMKVLGSYPK